MKSQTTFSWPATVCLKADLQRGPKRQG